MILEIGLAFCLITGIPAFIFMLEFFRKVGKGSWFKGLIKFINAETLDQETWL